MDGYRWAGKMKVCQLLSLSSRVYWYLFRLLMCSRRNIFVHTGEKGSLVLYVKTGLIDGRLCQRCCKNDSSVL